MSQQLIEALVAVAIMILVAFPVHEFSHALAAYRLGDSTARWQGRLTLNPIVHFDPLGGALLAVSALLGGVFIGWAKPTPVNPRNFRHPVRDDILTSLAGPASNFLVVLLTVAALGLLSLTSPAAHLVVHAVARSAWTMVLAFNVSGITPLALMLHQLMFISILLGIFNLIPVPPLDGSHVLRHFLRGEALRFYDRAGTIGLVLLLFFGGRLLGALMFPVVRFFNDILTRI